MDGRFVCVCLEQHSKATSSKVRQILLLTLHTLAEHGFALCRQNSPDGDIYGPSKRQPRAERG